MSTTACFSKGTWTGRTLLHRQVGATKSGLTHGGSTWRNLATSQVHKPASSLQCMRHWRFSVYEGLMCSNLDTEGRKEAGAGRTGRGRGAFLFLWRKVWGAPSRGWQPPSLAATRTTQRAGVFRDHSLETLMCEQDSQALHCHLKVT